jgi:RimJ/RimL family protein N-acetyltransferase
MIHLETKNLIIRNLQEKDTTDFYEYRSNPVIGKFQSYDPYTLEQCKTFIDEVKDLIFGERGSWVQWGIVLKREDKLIGDIGLKPEVYDERIVEFGITLSPLYAGKGYAKEALKEIFYYLFLEKQIHRIIGIVDVENVSCIHLLQSLGLKQEAHFKQSFWNKGAWRDEYLFAILESEFVKY